ncbi:MAG TPA: hypothetical protein VHD56_19855 [Tepidisphaeraceae bacterium]|nr:hypothetical protein [Tepidisphaeraceae bacterium]
MTQVDSNPPKRSGKMTAFFVVGAILLVSAVGMSTATQYMHLHFRKLPVPLAKQLKELPDHFGPWVEVSIDEGLDHDVQDALATDKFIFRDYIDSRQVTQKEIDQFKDKTAKERRMLLAEIRVRKPLAVVNLGLTYYTGLADTVAHVPERCYVADGYEPTTYNIESWDVLKDRPGDHKLRYIIFEDSTPGRGSVTRNVAYFFNCNGLYMNDSIAVRMRLANLFEQYGYYMKVEVQTFNLSQQDSSRIMNDFLTYLLPESEKCLPDWNKISTSGAPTTESVEK